MSLIKTIVDRWNSETPKFFKGIKKLALTLGGSAMSLWALNNTMNLELDESILNVCKYFIVIAVAMGFTAQLTQVPQNTVEPPKEEL